MISDEYQSILRKAHENDDTWGSTGYKHAPWVAEFIDRHKLDSVLDFGCGKGHLGNAVREDREYLEWCEYDPGIPGKDVLPNKCFDLVVATDVLEHIEPDHLPSVLTLLGMLSSRSIMLHIHTGPARALLPDGRNAHLIQEDRDWWTKRLAEHIPHLETVYLREDPIDTRFDIILSPKA